MDQMTYTTTDTEVPMDFKPTHEMFDANGDSRGLYIWGCGYWTSADVWFNGGRVLRQAEVEEWGWRARSLSDLFRAHYATVHGADGSECTDGCEVTK